MFSAFPTCLLTSFNFFSNSSLVFLSVTSFSFSSKSLMSSSNLYNAVIYVGAGRIPLATANGKVICDATFPLNISSSP